MRVRPLDETVFRYVLGDIRAYLEGGSVLGVGDGLPESFRSRRAPDPRGPHADEGIRRPDKVGEAGGTLSLQRWLGCGRRGGVRVAVGVYVDVDVH